MALTSEQARVVADLKAGQPQEFRLPITPAGSATAGYLMPLTHRLAEDAIVVDALFRWRRSHMPAFLTVFAPTPEKTRSYLTAFSLPDPARILFLAADAANQLVGHIGLCHIAADGAEIDNVIRGEHVDAPDFMICAHHTILHWAYSALGIPVAYLNVLSHNDRAIRTYQRAGFTEARRMPLVRHEIDGGYKLVPAQDAFGESTDAVLVRMELSRDSFYRNAP